jgi:PPOX class probable F420-dependent enzyme
MSSLSETLQPAELALLSEARRAVLATLKADGRPRLVPLAYAAGVEQGVVYSAIDEKPKSTDDPRQLARVRDILARPRVALLVDRWSEAWSELAWLRIEGEASLLEPDDEAGEHRLALVLLRERYPQYAEQRLESRPIVRIRVERAVSWGI